MPDGRTARVRVVQLDPESAALADGDREVEPPVLDAQLVEVTQRLAGEVADLGVVPLPLQLGDRPRRGSPPKCSAKRKNARGSLSSTDVSST